MITKTDSEKYLLPAENTTLFKLKMKIEDRKKLGDNWYEIEKSNKKKRG